MVFLTEIRTVSSDSKSRHNQTAKLPNFSHLPKHFERDFGLMLSLVALQAVLIVTDGDEILLRVCENPN